MDQNKHGVNVFSWASAIKYVWLKCQCSRESEEMKLGSITRCLSASLITIVLWKSRRSKSFKGNGQRGSSITRVLHLLYNNFTVSFVRFSRLRRCIDRMSVPISSNNLMPFYYSSFRNGLLFVIYFASWHESDPQLETWCITPSSHWRNRMSLMGLVLTFR